MSFISEFDNVISSLHDVTSVGWRHFRSQPRSHVWPRSGPDLAISLSITADMSWKYGHLIGRERSRGQNNAIWLVTPHTAPYTTHICTSCASNFRHTEYFRYTGNWWDQHGGSGNHGLAWTMSTICIIIVTLFNVSRKIADENPSANKGPLKYLKY